jgi:hypothetical protein
MNIHSHSFVLASIPATAAALPSFHGRRVRASKERRVPRCIASSLAPNSLSLTPSFLLNLCPRPPYLASLPISSPTTERQRPLFSLTAVPHHWDDQGFV